QEKRYSQTEKEALAIVWACEKFTIYLIGIKFELITDDKPLEVIYSVKSKPCARIERWVLRLQKTESVIIVTIEQATKEDGEIQLNDIKQYGEQLQEKEPELEEIENEIRRISSIQQKWSNTKQQLKLRQHELGLVKQRVQNTAKHQQQEETENIKKNIAELTERIQVCKETEIKCNKKVKELEVKMKDTKEISELEKGLENIHQQIAATEENLIKLKEQCAEPKNDAAEKKEIVVKLQQEYKAEKGIIAEVQKKRLIAQVHEYKLEVKKLDHDIKKLKDDFKNSKNREVEFAKKVKEDDKNLKNAQELSNAEATDLEIRIRNAQKN
ncbi:hypothetical protein ILUMI_07253, partial [Ignelater luminosus]